MLAIISVLLCFTLTGCLSIVGGIIGGLDAVFRFVQAFGEDILPENTVYGSQNPLAVSFRNGDITAIWDTDEDYSYIVSVTDDRGVTTVYAPDDDLHTEYKDWYDDGSFSLQKAGFDYADNFSVSLKKINKNNIYETATCSYEGLSKKDYATYTKNVPGGFVDIDSYIATRYEMFEYFAYLLIFRPDAIETSDGSDDYEKVEQDFWLAYDYMGVYDDELSADDAFESEVLSAVASFEDSAAYTYSYDRNGNVGSYTLEFFYDSDPYLTTDTKKHYSNAITFGEYVHYDDSTYHDRSFAIDSRENSVTVNSSDQLYFAIKKGYKPAPVAGSNAEYVYAELRNVLSKIVADTDSDPTKIHSIYDYLVNTVIYDYNFVDNTLNEDVEDESIFFSYQCLYLEGVLGWNAKTKSFRSADRVAICDGLSKAFLCLTQIEGINSLKISGTAGDEAHAWNKVYVNRRWYMVDTTWGNTLTSDGSGKEYLSHDYLMVRDDASHVEDQWFYYPKATGKYSFISI